jgi:hypothetical protein
MENNSQFKIRREFVALSTGTTTTNIADENQPDPDPSATTTTDAGTDQGTDTNTDTNTDSPNTTDTVTEEKPTTTATVTSPDLPKKECSGYCKMYNILTLGVTGATILLLLAVSFYAVKSAGSSKPST